MLSVVIPAFNEQEMVPAAAEQIDGVLLRAGIPHELIFIDDGSRDATWAEIRAESERRDTVRGVHFRAISARRLPFLPACRRRTVTVSP